MARVHIGNAYPRDEYLLARCAPAGYGLGAIGTHRQISSLAELDDIVQNGWYAIYSPNVLNLGGLDFNGLTLEVSMYSDLYGFQVARHFGINGEMRRYMTDSVWGEWEWENPPMVFGEEYRTTERWNGKPMYTTLISFGSIASTQEVRTTEFTADSVVRICGCVDGNCLPIINGTLDNANSAWANASVSDGFVSASITCGSGMVGKGAAVQLWYIKV